LWTNLFISWGPTDKKITLGDGVDNVAMTFDPANIGDESKGGSLVTCFLTGYGTSSCPNGQVIIYLSCPVELTQTHSPELFLRPYVEVLLRSCAGYSPTLPLFELYYREVLTGRNNCLGVAVPQGPGCFVVDESPPAIATLTETGDVLTERATTLFCEVSTLISGDRNTRLPEHIWATNESIDELKN